MLECNNIFQGNYFDLIKSIDDNSIDLIVCDGPYSITKMSWDKVGDIQDFNLTLIQEFSRVLKPGGSLYLFGKHNCIDFIDYRPHLQLNSRIVWFQPSRLSQGRKKYTSNYDIIAYFSKGISKTYNLDAIRTKHLIDKKHIESCENVPSVQSSKYKCFYNKLGKNPGDVWSDIKQLTYRSNELISKDYLNTIQKPLKLYERIIRASSNENDIVLDPFSGTGTTAECCVNENRRFICFEQNEELIRLSHGRVEKALKLSESCIKKASKI